MSQKTILYDSSYYPNESEIPIIMLSKSVEIVGIICEYKIVGIDRVINFYTDDRQYIIHLPVGLGKKVLPILHNYVTEIEDETLFISKERFGSSDLVQLKILVKVPEMSL